MHTLAAIDRTAARAHQALTADGGPTPVVVGDALAAIHAPAAGHRPGDIDLVVPGSVADARARLLAAGWRPAGGTYRRAELPWPIDLVGSALRIGGQPAGPPVVRDSPWGAYQLLSPRDAVLDRLAGWLYWRSDRDRRLAVLMMRAQSIDTAELVPWLTAEGLAVSALHSLDQDIGN